MDWQLDEVSENGDDGEEEAYQRSRGRWVGGIEYVRVCEWVSRRLMLLVLSLEDNAVDDDNPVGEDHQHLDETLILMISISIHWIHTTLHMI